MMTSYDIGETLLNEVSKLDKKPKLLIHACCAPCSTYPLTRLKDLFDITIYFNNSNIYPFLEYDRRKDELIKFLGVFNKENNVDIKLIITDYDGENFTRKLEYGKDEREKGKRCKFCYAYRLNEAYLYALENNFDYFSTVMTISSQKDEKTLNNIGRILESKHKKVKFIEHNFKKKNGHHKKIELTKKYNLYNQQYCGCKFSFDNKKI